MTLEKEPLEEERGGDINPIQVMSDVRIMLGNYNNSRENEYISNEISYNNLNTDHNNNSTAGNIQFPSGCNSDPSDQLSRSRHIRPGNNHSLHGGNPGHPVQFSRLISNNNLSPIVFMGKLGPESRGNMGM